MTRKPITWSLSAATLTCLLAGCSELETISAPSTEILVGSIDLSTHRDTAALKASGQPVILEIGRSEVQRTLAFQDAQFESYVMSLEAPLGTLLSTYAPEAPAEQTCVQSGGATPAVKIARASWRLRTPDAMLKDVRLIGEDRDSKGLIRGYPELWYAGAPSKIDATLSCTDRDGLVTVWKDQLQLQAGWNVVVRVNTTRTSASPSQVATFNLVSTGLTSR